MTYVIGRKCVDVMHRDCVQECPVDCIYEGDRSLYINPNECVDCGACKLICEVGAIYYEADPPDDEVLHLIDNAAFFARTLPDRDAPLGNPGGATELGRVGVDTPYVASLPRNEPKE
jgi:NAD-dependent dihydropyrimidine dehydrogenase PreA subunit